MWVVGVGAVGMKGIRDVAGIDIGVGVGVGVGLARVGSMVRVVGIVVVADSVVVVVAGRSNLIEAWRILVAGIGEVARRVGAVMGKLVEDRSAEGAVEENRRPSVVTDVTAVA